MRSVTDPATPETPGSPPASAPTETTSAPLGPPETASIAPSLAASGTSPDVDGGADLPLASLEAARRAVFDPVLDPVLLSADLRNHVRGLVPLAGPSLDRIYTSLASGTPQALHGLAPDGSDLAGTGTPDRLTDAIEAERLSGEGFRADLSALPRAVLDADDMAYLTAERAMVDRVQDRLGLPRSRASAPVASRATRAQAQGLPDRFALASGVHTVTIGDLQTLLTPDEGRRKVLELCALGEEGRALHGASPLHIVYGILEWRDGDGRDRFSPLLLQPVAALAPAPRQGAKADRPSIHGRVRAPSDRLLVNPALLSALEGTGFDLPGLGRQDQPEGYLKAVTQALETFALWRVHHWRVHPYCVLGAFDCAAHRLWADLDPATWSDPAGRAAALFLQAGRARPNPSFADAADGTIVLAPPGTDKAGYVRNLVIETLGRGETVLLVSTSDGPLDAVKTALATTTAPPGEHASKAGPDISPFVLDGRAADRRQTDILEAIRNRHGLVRTPAEQDPADIRRALEQASQALEALETPFGATGITPADIVRAETKAAGLALNPAFDGVDLVHADELDAEGRERCRIALSDLEKAWADRAGATRGAPPPGLSPWANLAAIPDTDRLKAIKAGLAQWLDALPRLISAAAGLAERLALPAPATTDEVTRLLGLTPEPRVLKTLQADPSLIPVLPVLADPTTETAARRLNGLWKQLDAIDADLKKTFDAVEPVSTRTDDVALLLQAWNRLPEPPNTLLGIKGDLDNLETRVEAVGQDRTFVTGFASALDLPAPDTAADLRLLQEAATLIDQTPRPALQANREALREETARASAAHLVNEIRTLRSRMRKLRKYMRVTLEIPPRVLLRAAHQLATTPLLLRPFSRRYAKARRLRDRILRRPQRVGTAPALLRALGDFTRMVDNFEDREEPVTLLGPLFKGIDTDTTLVEATVGFVEKAVSFAEAGSFGAALGEALCTASPDSLMRFAHDMGGEDGARLDAIRNRLETDEEDGLQAADLRLQVRQDAYDHILALGNALGLQDTVHREHLDDAVARLRQRSTLVNGELPSLETTIKALEAVGYDRANKARRVAALALLEALAPTDAGAGLDPARWRRNILASPALKDVPALETARVQTGELLKDVRAIEDGLGRDLDQPLADLAGRSLSGGLPLRDGIAWAARAMASDPIRDKAVTDARANAIEAGLEPLVAACEAADIRADLSPVFDKVYWESLGRRLREAARPPLNPSADPEALRTEKHALEATLAQAESNAVRRVLMNRTIPPGAGGTAPDHAREGELLPHVISGDVPVDRLFDQAPRTLQALMPCWLADPASLPILAPPPAEPFDLVVLLEANSVAEGPALSALLRARRAIFVGDEHQMPPPSFTLPWTDWTAERSGGRGDTDGPARALFDRARTCLPPGPDLWSLEPETNPDVLAFLNARFYGGRLVAPDTPAPRPKWSDGAAIQCHRVEGLASGDVNLIEAQAILDTARDHMEREPDTALGIVTTTSRQAALIKVLMDRRRSTDRVVDDYLDRWGDAAEGFYVRPIEATAGERRPVILASLVWARSKPNWPVPQSFGRLSGLHGERFLVTLLSRAQRRIHLFTSLSADDLPGQDETPAGVRTLKALLTALEDEAGAVF